MNNAKEGQWAGSGSPTKKDNMVRHPSCKFNPIANNLQKTPCLNPQLKSPKCFIKISGSRYNGTFLLNIDNGLDDTIYHTMRDIEVALEDKVDPMGKPRVSPKNCLSSVFRCFGTSELNEKVMCKKKKKKDTKAINKTNIGPLINAVQSNSYNKTPDTSNESIMREVVDVFRAKLDQFCKGNPSASEVATALHLEPSQNQFLSQSHTKPETHLTNPSVEDSEKVSFIRFSQEEVLVIQPPKPLTDSVEVEVGIEVKPKTTATNVGQSIKLAKDKVLIGVQDGRGVLQISDQVPKRTLQMLIEEGVNGKPSMKLSVSEETPDKNPDSKKMNCAETKFRESPEWSMINKDCNKKCKGEGDMVPFQHFNPQPACKKLRSYKSVESQVSWTHLKPRENIVKYRTESTQYDYQTPIEPHFISRSCVCTESAHRRTSDANVGNDTDESQVTFVEKPLSRSNFEFPKQKDFRNYRLPYFVHTLYEPRSLNSSSCLVSDEPSLNCSIASKTDKSLKPKKSITFSSGHSNSSKCTKIFRSIGEISTKSSKPWGSKDAGMTTNLIEDFEKVLQTMCGSNYMHHNSEQSVQKHIEGMRQHEESNELEKPKTFGLSFDQWTQTDNQRQCVHSPSEYTAKDHKPQEKDTTVELKGKSRTRDKSMRKRSKSNAPGSEDGTSVSSSATEEELISDSSDGTNPSLCSGSESPNNHGGNNKKLIGDSFIDGKAKSFVGQAIFAAIEERTIDPDLFTSIAKADSFIHPACKDKSGLALNEGRNINVVNMALYQGPSTLPLPVMANGGEEALPECLMGMRQSETLDRLSGPCVEANRFSPIRLKSKSCQNLSTAPSVIKVNRTGLGKNLCADRHHIKLRYPLLTATDSCRASNVNVCGILNLHDVEMKNANQPVEKIPARTDCNLPSAIRQLLLPSQRSAVITHVDQERSPTHYCDYLMSTADYREYETFDRIENDWCTSNEAAESVTSRALRKNIFKKTVFAMKTARTAVGKTFCTLLRKLSLSDTINKKKTMTEDRLVYVAIPLEKKRENLRLFTKMQ